MCPKAITGLKKQPVLSPGNIFFLTCSTAKFHWTEIDQVVACQYEQTLTDEHVNAVDLSTKVNYLERNPVTVCIKAT